MNKILVLLKGDTIDFSLYKKNIIDDNINNTDVINMENLKFTEDYILNNYELVSSFFNLVVIKKNISTALINNLEIAEIVLIILKKLKNINTVIFKENKGLNYTISSYLMKNIYLNRIECYSMPLIMFDKFRDGIVITRELILCNSDFINYNNIKTYSDLCSKDKIIIDSYLTFSDVDDIIYFFKTNKRLKKIYIKGYKRNNLITFLKMLKENNFKKICIILIDDDNVNKSLIEDSHIFNKLNKQYNVLIKIKYSNKYREKNKVYELILNMCKIFLIMIIIIILFLFIFSRKKIEKMDKSIQNNLNIIDEIVKENTGKIKNNTNEPKDNIIEDNNIVEESITETEKEEYISPYYVNYDKVYNELLKINEDTVGWIRINNTKIDYPLVQYSDNDYYLSHAFDKSYNQYGWLYVDYRNNMNIIDKNIIIYGHDTLNNLLFGTLKKVLKDEWNSNEDNLTFLLNIKGNDYYYKIFSIYTIDKTNDYLVTEFNDFMNYIDMVKNRSIKDFNVEVSDDDSIVTLSTCFQGANNRLVLHAKKI